VVKLFISGVGPGLLSCIGLSLVAYTIAKKNRMPRGDMPSFKIILNSIKRAIFALLMPIIILGGIYSGVFTATESAAIAVIYGVVVSVFVYRDVNIRSLFNLFKRVSISTANLMILIAAANVFGYLVGYFTIPRMISTAVMQYASNVVVFFIFCGLLFLLSGMFMEAAATTVILAPILHPLALSFGIDPVQFGCFMVFMLCIGIATPPFAPTLFVACGLTKEPVVNVAKRVMPFVGEQVFVAILIACVPAFSIWLTQFV
jgi:C4-dicarboxylate transporter DctM subunit